MNEREQAEVFAKSAPELNQKELDAINGLFPTYIFRRLKTRELWTTCCRKHVQLPKWNEPQSCEERYIMTELHQREPQNSYQDPPEPMNRCPYCGTPVIVKELGRTGSRKNLSRYRRAVVLRWYRGALWATAYDCGKHYVNGYDLTGQPDWHLIAVYRFRPGGAEGTVRPWYWCKNPFTSMERQDGPLTKGKWKISEPFGYRTDYGMGYDVIGMEEIQKSQFRYCMAEQYEKCGGGIIRFLTACCIYPRQIEMLMKAGMDEVVHDLAERGVKNAAAINWNETAPDKAFGLTKQEMRVFMGTRKDIRTIALYKRLGRRVPMPEADQWVERCADIRGTFHEARTWNLPPERLFRYIAGYSADRHMGNTLHLWKDYLTAAQAMGYPLHRENVLLPRDLGEAHDRATAEHRNKLEQQRQKDEQERRRLRSLSYQQRREELEKKYGYAAEGLVIRVPAGEEEIIAEGRALQHCVGGYAQRHVEGTATILFMRKEKKPDKPFLTIEMRGNTMVQIHGYKNEGLYTAKGRFAPDPREVYRDFLDTWLDWLKKGSRRDKDGAPVLPKKKKEDKIA